MSTFNGIVHEFPDIAIDFFRPRDRRCPALACFLSHVHSDHLAGLETLNSPFVYCSAATREILLRLERYPCRINYAQGKIEARKQTYRRLNSLLKPIPLETPTELELAPGNLIQVTLLDANHCTGAVMFLIEGSGKAVLYTGDIRSEPWWVNSIARNPSMIEYSLGLKTLDRIYLDTSILDDYHQQSKANGLKELIEKASKYPDDTVFCVQAWTYGYEEVWIALSKALKSKIHVDEYKMRVYKSLVAKSSSDRFGQQFHLAREAPFLVGFSCGNNQHEGCLTLKEDVRLHSCEKGTPCSVMLNRPIVWIQPIVARLPNGCDVAEIGIGGGGDDLGRELELEFIMPEAVELLIQKVGEDDSIPPELKEQMRSTLEKFMQTGRSLSVNMDISELNQDNEASLVCAIKSMVRKAKSMAKMAASKDQSEIPAASMKSLPNKIRFPYARHSSLPELRHFLETFKPKDIWPCTVDETYWHPKGVTIRGLFGEYCSGDLFEHDMEMEKLLKERLDRDQELRKELNSEESQQTASPIPPSSPILPSADPRVPDKNKLQTGNRTPTRVSYEVAPKVDIISISSADSSPPVLTQLSQASKRSFDTFNDDNQIELTEPAYDDELDLQGDSQASSLSARSYETRLRAFQAMEDNADGEAWNSISLISTTNHHTTPDQGLGMG